jgi:hypothetical protein
VTVRDGGPEPDWAPRGPEFAAWHFWVGVNSMYYARVPGTSPPVCQMGESPQALAELILATAPPWWMARSTW